MTITYEKTKDKNIIKKVETNDSYIHLDKLQKEIDNLQSEINDIPKPKTKPDQETLDFWNDMRPSTNIDDLKGELIEKQKLFNQLKEVKG